MIKGSSDWNRLKLIQGKKICGVLSSREKLELKELERLARTK